MSQSEMIRWAQSAYWVSFFGLDSKICVGACYANEVICKCPAACFILGFVFRGLWALAEAPIITTAAASMEPAQ
eukprot:1140556-Pelagomonas_calceolata.AAC.1